ncbi:MAG: hypothetical protein WCI22_02540 [Actinomycetota bacterium]
MSRTDGGQLEQCSAPAVAVDVPWHVQWRIRILGMSTAVVLCATYLAIRPDSIDRSSGLFRTQLFHRHVFFWNNLWFGGHSLPGYGMVSPALNSIVGMQITGVVSVLLGAWCFCLLVESWRVGRPDLSSPELAAVLFACGSASSLWSGRMTFTPAIGLGAACLLAVFRGRIVLAIACAALCGLASPVGALSLMVVLGAIWVTGNVPRTRTLFVGVAAAVPMGIILVLFPEGGWYPFTGASFILLVIALATIGWYGRDLPAVRWGVLAYLVVAVAAFAIRSPLGGNVVRLGWLAAGAMGALVIREHRRTMLIAFSVFALIWGWSGASMALHTPAPTAYAAYYTSLSDYLGSMSGVHRVEVVPTPDYMQAATVALTVGIARGWQTQVDRQLNPEFYDGKLTDTAFHQWLLRDSVDYVALPLAAVHDKSQDEARIVRAGPSYLHLVWSDVNWRVYRVVGAQPLADNGATLIDVQPESLTVRLNRPGDTVVKFRYTDMYEVASGHACISATPQQWIQIHSTVVETVHLEISALHKLSLAGDDNCT